MSVIAYKFLVAMLCALMTITSGLIALKLIRRYQSWLSIGHSFADGVFIGVAIFHLIPETLHILSHTCSRYATYAWTLTLTIAGFLLLVLLEKLVAKQVEYHKRQVSTTGTLSLWVFIAILSIHAFIAGSALGFENTIASVSILLIAIIAHKGFETFSLMVNIHRQIKNEKTVSVILYFFACVTPLGIILASLTTILLHQALNAFILALFHAFAAGTFLYIGTLHHHKPSETLSTDTRHADHRHYQKILASLVGIALMSGLSYTHG